MLKTGSPRNNIYINIRAVSPGVDFFNFSYWLSKFLAYLLRSGGYYHAVIQGTLRRADLQTVFNFSHLEKIMLNDQIFLDKII